MTWRVESIEARSARLDFTGSEQGCCEAVQVLFDGEIFANAVGLTDWTAEPIQAEVCESCGIEGCNSDGWIALRGAGALRAFIPAFGEMAEDDLSRYGPPAIVRRRGAPLLGPGPFRRLREIVRGLPPDPPAITSEETLRLLAFEAPRRLRETGTSLRRDFARSLLAAEGCELREGTEALLRLVEILAADDVKMSARPQRPPDRSVTFHVDDANLSAWQPIVLTPSGPAVSWSGWIAERL